jgi:DNA-binding LytR/AlgR family response regulator
MAIEVLEQHIEKYGDLQIDGTFQNAVEAFRALQEQQVDLLFLDIEMPKLTGLELLRTLQYPPKVILTTAYREYAVEGFELDVVDYLVKPISFNRFLKAMGKVAQHQTTIIPQGDKADTTDQFIVVNVDKKHVKIPLDDILYIESQRDHVKITTGSKAIRTPYKISSLEEKLRPKGFIRIHRSFLVPIKKIAGWTASEIEVRDTTLPVGRTYKNEVMRILESQSEIL